MDKNKFLDDLTEVYEFLDSQKIKSFVNYDFIRYQEIGQELDTEDKKINYMI